MRTLNVACLLVFVGIWLEKGMGLVVPGFIPTPLGEVFEYFPTAFEICIAIGIWALAALAFTLATRVVVAVELAEISNTKSRAICNDGAPGKIRSLGAPPTPMRQRSCATDMAHVPGEAGTPQVRGQGLRVARVLRVCGSTPPTVGTTCAWQKFQGISWRANFNRDLARQSLPGWQRLAADALPGASSKS